VLLKIVYLLTCRVLGLAVLVFRGELAKDAELPVLRHENAVLRRAGQVRCEPADRAWFAALRLAGHQVNPIFERDRISAVDVEIADTQALAAPPDLESRVNSRPVPGRLDPPTGLGGAEERAEPQTFYAADLGSVDEDDQTP
jgi:hypothetical protein